MGRKLNMFVGNKTVEVSDNKGNTIIVRKKMSLGIQARVQQELYQLRMEVAGDAQDPTMIVSMGLNQLVLLKHNIVSWSGPEFEGFACTKKNIEDMDASEPLIIKVLERIEELNRPAFAEPRNEEEKADPKLLESAT